MHILFPSRAIEQQHRLGTCRVVANLHSIFQAGAITVNKSLKSKISFVLKISLYQRFMPSMHLLTGKVVHFCPVRKQLQHCTAFEEFIFLPIYGMLAETPFLSSSTDAYNIWCTHTHCHAHFSSTLKTTNAIAFKTCVRIVRLSQLQFWTEGGVESVCADTNFADFLLNKSRFCNRAHWLFSMILVLSHYYGQFLQGTKASISIRHDGTT